MSRRHKLEFDEEATQSIIPNFGTGAFVFKNKNGSRVILEKIGDRWSHLTSSPNPWGSPPVDDDDENENPEDEDDGGKKKNKKVKKPSQKKRKKTPGGGCGTNMGKGKKEVTAIPEANPDNTAPGDNSVDENYYQKLQKEIDKMERTGKDYQQPEKEHKESNGVDDFTRKEKNIYEAMRDELDKQIRGFYKNGKFSISPEKMMNEVFANIMKKYGYKTYAGKWFKKAIDGVNYVKSTLKKLQSETLTAIKKKLEGKITNKTIRELLGLEGNKWWRITRLWDLGKIIRTIRSNPLSFVMKAFTDGTEASTTFKALIEAVGGDAAGDVMSYVITCLFF